MARVSKVGTRGSDRFEEKAFKRIFVNWALPSSHELSLENTFTFNAYLSGVHDGIYRDK